MPKRLPTPTTPTPPDDPAEFARPLDFTTQATGPIEFAKATEGSVIGKSNSIGGM
jgi:hypothetical protein